MEAVLDYPVTKTNVLGAGGILPRRANPVHSVNKVYSKI